MRARLLDAGAWALLALLLAGPMAGLRLQTEGTGLTLVTQWRPLAVIVVLVFVFRLLQQTALPALTRLALPKPRLSGAGLARHPAVLGLLFAVAVIWPFFASRGAIDLATLALIYVMLGLGLNIVVGLAGLLDLGYVAFYAIGAYG